MKTESETELALLPGMFTHTRNLLCDNHERIMTGASATQQSDNDRIFFFYVFNWQNNILTA